MLKVKFKVLQEDYFTPNSLLSIIELENDLKEFQNQLSSNALELDRLEKAADSLNDFEKSVNLMKLFKFIISSSGSSDYMNHNILIEFLNSLNLLICKCRLNGFRSCGTELVRCCIRDYMPTFYRFLNHSKKTLIHATLALLTTMVMHSPSTATDIMAVFNFNLKPLPSFLNMRLRKKMKKDSSTADQLSATLDEGNIVTVVEPVTIPTALTTDDIVSKDIRGVYIKFLLAFLHRGDNMVKKTVLETKNLLHLIFKDMKNDCFDTVEFVLSTFDRKVLKDLRIPKTTKLHFFHIGILQQLVGLYSNSDPTLHSSNVSSTLKSDDAKTIADLAHDFLIKLCCVPGQGICFQDNGWYPANTSKSTLMQNNQRILSSEAISNPLLGKLLLTLKISTDLLQRELFLKVIDVCPELVHYYWTNATHLSFEPRSSIFYIANIALVTSVLQKPIPHEFMGKSNNILSPPPIATTMSNILPSPLSKQISSKALQHASRDVRFACCRQLTASFEKLEKVLHHCADILETLKSYDSLETWHRVALEREWTEWRLCVVEKVRATLPDPNIIILLRKSALLPPIETDDGDISVHDMVLAHLGLLKYYLTYHSAAMLDMRYDFGKLLNGLNANSKGEGGWSNESLGLIVQVLSQLEGFKWWNKSEEKHTFFRILLDLYLVIADPVLKREMEALFYQFLDSTVAFQGHSDASKIFWKLVWKQGSEIAHAVEKTVLIFSSSSSLQIEDSLVPPLYVQLIREWKRDTPATVKVFVSSLVMQDCRESGSVERCQLYLELIRNEADECMVKKCLVGWLLYCLGEESHSSLATVDWKTAKSMLKTNNAVEFIESLFQISPQSFLEAWEKLFKKFQAYSTYIYVYMQMTLGPCQGTLDASFFNTPAATDSSLLLELLFLRSLYSSGTSSFQPHVSLYSEIEKQSPLAKIGMTHILFYIDSWSIAFRGGDDKMNIEKVDDRLCGAFSLISRILRGAPHLAEKALGHSVMLSCFLPLEMDKYFGDQVYDAVLNILHIESSNKPLYTKKFIEHVIANSAISKLSPFTIKSFRILADSFDESDLDLIANVMLKSESRNAVMSEILWSCIARNPTVGNSKTFVGALIQQLEEENVFPIDLLGLLKKKTAVNCAEILGLIDLSLFERLLQKRSKDIWDFVCWICGKSIAHALWLAEAIKGERVQSLSKMEKLQVLKALTLKLYNRSTGKWRGQIPKPFWKFIKSLSKSTIDIQADRISRSLVGDPSLDIAVDVSEAFLILATVEIHGLEVTEKIASKLESNLKKDIANMALSISSLLSYFRVLMSVGHALSTSLSTFAVWLTCSYYESQKWRVIESDEEKTLEKNMVLLMDIVSKSEQVQIGNSEIYRLFVAASLKYRITNRASLSFLQMLIQHNGILFPPSEILDMITSHSLFNTLIQSVMEENKTIPVHHDCKAALLNLIYQLLKLDPASCCKIDLARKLALNYYGTTSEPDVASLQIFHFFERVAHISMSDFLSCWGNQVDSKVSCFAESLGAIDNIWMANTIHWFPLDKDVDVVTTETRGLSSRIFSSKCQPLYDASFFLPLTAAALMDRNTPVDVHRLLESNLIGLAIMALSSLSLHTRKIGHFVIYHYYEALKESSVKEKNQVILLLDSLRNSMESSSEEAFPIISGIIASFVAQGLMILMKPESDLYPLVNRFCLQRDQIDLLDIPMFYDLFYSTNEDCRKERIWILRLISNGIKSKLDFQLLARRHVFSIMIAFFNSSIADTVTRKLIIEILFKVSVIPSAVSNLITKSGLMSFFKTLFSTLSFSSSNDLSLAIPELFQAVVTGYLKSPTSWDGKLSRQVWMAQSLDILHLLIANLNNLPFSKEAWATTFALRTLRVCKCVLHATDDAGLSLSLEHLQILYRVLSNFASSPAPFEVQAEELNALSLSSPLNMESVFEEDVGSPYKLHIARKYFIDILLATSSFPTTGGIFVTTDLVLWTLEEEHHQSKIWRVPFLVWLLKLIIGRSLHREISEAERNSLLRYLGNCHYSDCAADLEMQLVRACLVVLYRDDAGSLEKLGKRKRPMDENGDRSSFDSGQSLHETIAQLVHLTPSPKYLFSTIGTLALPSSESLQAEEDCDSFQQVLFGEILGLNLDGQHRVLSSLSSLILQNLTA